MSSDFRQLPGISRKSSEIPSHVFNEIAESEMLVIFLGIDIPKKKIPEKDVS